MTVYYVKDKFWTNRNILDYGIVVIRFVKSESSKDILRVM